MYLPVRSIVLVPILLALARGAGSADPPRSDRFAGEPREPPSRDFDFQHLKLECTFDWDAEEVRGNVTHRASAFRSGIRRMTLDAVEIDVGAVRDGSGRELAHESYPERLEIDLGRELARGAEVTVTIEYRARPRRGLYFFKPDVSNPAVPQQVWSQGECDEARHWIPCFDHPVDKLTTEVLVSAPRPLVAISNGRLVSTREDGSGRLFHWTQERPHTTYLISVVVGEFATWKDSWNGVPITAYVDPRRIDLAPRSFELTADMMAFFSEKTGYPYPWEKYDQVCVYGFLFGGMENTSATTLTDGTLHDERAALHVESTGLVAHELAHQWFGDLITCKDWADIWLNESFATFWENLYREHREGWDEAVFERHEQGLSYKAEDRREYRRRLSVRTYRNPGHVFDRHAYPKGARVLNMLRYVLGEERFFAGIELYLKRHAFQPVETADFRAAMEEASGESLRWFFDQWVHSGGHPEYRVRSTWSRDEGQVRITVEQMQKVDDLTPLFRMPVDIAITTPAGTARHRVRVEGPRETFSFPASDRPLCVRFDPGDWILKDLDFEKSREEWLFQLSRDEDVMGRLEAAAALEAHVASDAAGEALAARLREEPFWGVRARIAQALGKAGNEAAETALATAFNEEPKTHVRIAILRALRKEGGAGGAELARRAIAGDPSYHVVAAALRTLAKNEREGACRDLMAALERDSHAEVIRVAAVDSLAEIAARLDESAAREVTGRLLALAKPGSLGPLRTSSCSALVAFEKEGRAKAPGVFEAVSSALDDRVAFVRWGAIRALGELGDRRGIELLEKHRARAVSSIFNDAQRMIDAAIARLRNGGDRDSLRTEIDRLTERAERLERRFSELEKRPARARF